MEKPFILNPSVSSLTLQDAIDEKMDKIKGVLNCLIFSLEFTQDDQELDHSSVYHALWAIDEFLEEINCMRRKLNEIQ